MLPTTLISQQRAIAESPLDSRTFLEGIAGSGKTTAAIARLHYLLGQGVPANEVLVWVPQLTLGLVYRQALNQPEVGAGGQATIITLGGLARRMVALFWPLVAEEAGFAHPDHPPTFLTLETAQYHMAAIAEPLLGEGYFETVTIDRNRLYSQVIDNLNKAAVIGFDHREIGQRLKEAWVGEESQRRVYDDAQQCASQFREYCLAYNLLDYSLQVEVFIKYLWPSPLCHDYLLACYPHLIVDNIEEDTPVAHDVLRAWLPECQSALVVYDHNAGYRAFLGADDANAYGLKYLCQFSATLEQSLVMSSDVQALAGGLAQALDDEAQPDGQGDLRAALVSNRYHRYFPEMIDWVAGEVTELVNERGVPPGEIVVMAPFLSDALRFALQNRLEAAGVPVQSHRPSRALQDEPATQCLLTLAVLAHPEWHLRSSDFDITYALMQAIEDLDLVRARLLTGALYRFHGETKALMPFEQLNVDSQERITYLLGERYEGLRAWLDDYAAGPTDIFDHFLSRLFGEVLSQPGYGFHWDFDAAKVATNLIESVRKFRWATENGSAVDDPGAVGREYMQLVDDGVIAAQYIQSWEMQTIDAVLLAPAYTFLLSNRPVEYQFWLNVNSRGWSERIDQPLTHPHVLSRHWSPGRTWTDRDEVERSQQALYRLALGLLRRCRRRVYLGLSELDEQGHDQIGSLLRAIQRVLRRLPPETEPADDV